MPAARVLTEPDESDHYKVAKWRLDELVKAGYAEWDAAKLAVSDVDLHKAVELVEQGCDPDLAARILL